MLYEILDNDKAHNLPQHIFKIAFTNVNDIPLLLYTLYRVVDWRHKQIMSRNCNRSFTCTNLIKVKQPQQQQF